MGFKPGMKNPAPRGHEVDGAAALYKPGHADVEAGTPMRNDMFGHDGAYGTDLSVHPGTGMIALFLVQCSSGDQWEARDNFLKAAAETFEKSKQGK